MIVLGLTGSIGMGKSTAAAMLRRLGVPVHDADRAVHRLMAKGGKAVPLVARAFPDAVTGGVVDRAALGRIVFADRAALMTLEHILHPMVRADERRFLAAATRRGARLVVLDIPLLFETGGERRCAASRRSSTRWCVATSAASSPAWRGGASQSSSSTSRCSSKAAASGAAMPSSW